MSKKSTRIRAAAIIIEEGRILLIAHRKKNNIYWLLPGGGVKFGESIEQALKRELMEELCIESDVRDVGIVCDSLQPEGKRHVVNICFHCSRTGGSYKLGSDKILYSFGFFAADDLGGIRIYPPIRDDLISILNGNDKRKIYLGARWE